MTVKNLTLKDFDKFIKTGNSVIDFYADWCRPCKLLKPIFHELSEKIKNIKFGAVDADKEPELIQKFQIMAIPTVIFFKENKQIDKFIGFIPKNEVIKKLKAVYKTKQS